MDFDIRSSFVKTLATLSLDQLVRQAETIAEAAAEDESAENAAHYRAQREVVDVIGRFRFGTRFGEALKAASVK